MHSQSAKVAFYTFIHSQSDTVAFYTFIQTLVTRVSILDSVHDNNIYSYVRFHLLKQDQMDFVYKTHT